MGGHQGAGLSTHGFGARLWSPIVVPTVLSETRFGAKTLCFTMDFVLLLPKGAPSEWHPFTTVNATGKHISGHRGLSLGNLFHAH